MISLQINGFGKTDGLAMISCLFIQIHPGPKGNGGEGAVRRKAQGNHTETNLLPELPD